MLGMSTSLLKTKRRFVVRVGDSTWLATRLDRLVAYCGGQVGLRARGGQTAPLLEDVDDAWTSCTYDTIDKLDHQHCDDKLKDIMGSICNQCNNHCTECVYDCQIRFDNADEEFFVNDLNDAVNRGVVGTDELECYSVCVDEDGWDNHRPLSQNITPNCDPQSGALKSSRRKKSGRRKKRMVVGGGRCNEPMWPAVLLTFDRGVNKNFKDSKIGETWC